jgi:hypothetical protein
MMRILVIVIALLQGGLIGLFALFALQGDAWGIARAMALLLSLPFVVLTVPAVLLLRSGRLRLAALIAALSAAVTWMAWRFA